MCAIPKGQVQRKDCSNDFGCSEDEICVNLGTLTKTVNFLAN